MSRLPSRERLRLETHSVVATIAERFVARVAAAAECHARILTHHSAIRVDDAHAPTDIEWAIGLRLNGCRIARLLARATIQPLDMQRAGRATRDDRGDLIRR